MERVAGRVEEHDAKRRASVDVPTPRKGKMLRSAERGCFYIIESLTSSTVKVRSIGRGRRNRTTEVSRWNWKDWCQKMNVTEVRWR